MAETIPFRDANGEMGVGDNDPDLVVAIPVRFVDYQDGVQATVSCWKLTTAELAMLQETGMLWLSVLGRGMPPVSISAERPF